MNNYRPVTCTSIGYLLLSTTFLQQFALQSESNAIFTYYVAITAPAGAVAKYYDEYVCLSARFSPEPHAQSSIFTGSIARSASRRYLINSEADFEFFRPAGATRCTDGGEIRRGGGALGPLLHAKFHHYRCNDKGV